MQLVPEGVGVLVLQRVEEARIPGVDELRHVDGEDAQGDDEREQGAGDPGFLHQDGAPEQSDRLALLGEPIGLRQHPQLGEEGVGVGDTGEEAVDHGGPWGGSLCALMSRNA